MIALTENDKQYLSDKLEKEFWAKYEAAANDVMQGRYGNGDYRRKAIKAAGLDYEVVQAIINLAVLGR